MSASAAVWPDPFGRLRITSPATPCHLSFLLPIADHRLNSLHLPSPAPPPFAPFTHSIPIGPHSGLLEHAVSAMLRSTLRPPRGLCRRSTADTALMCYQQLSGDGIWRSRFPASQAGSLAFNVLSHVHSAGAVCRLLVLGMSASCAPLAPPPRSRPRPRAAPTEALYSDSARWPAGWQRQTRNH